VALVIGFFVSAYFEYHRPLAPKAIDSGLNAIWVKHAWVGEPHTENDYREFAGLLKQNRISDVYAHVGPLNGDGTIVPTRYQHAPAFLARIRAHYGQCRIHAWVGQVEKQGGGPLDLSNEAARKSIIVTAHRLLDMGFDGIHYDVEPVASGDQHYVSLLRESRRLTQTRNKTTSVAAFKALPGPIVSTIEFLASQPIGLWDSSYFREVAQQVDQVAVMMYDTALPYDFLYGAATKFETRYLSKLVEPGQPLFIGIPTYDDRRLTFHAEAENMVSGLRGVRLAMPGMESEAIRQLGVAIYADWTTDQSEWQTYKRLWLKSG
jgi:hypothetical protein